MQTVVTTLFLFTAALPPRAALHGQQCDTVRSRVGLSGMQGLPIRDVEVQTLPPSVSFPGVAQPLSRVHAATLPSTVRRELLFGPDQPLDSSQVAESLRRLRALGYLEDVQLEARTCVDSAGVALKVITRDSWSTEPVVLIRPRSTALGVGESNVFGTGRAARLTVQSDAMGLGFGASVRDPALWNGRLDGQISSATYASGSSWGLALRRRRQSLTDPWTGELRWNDTHREAEGGSKDAFEQSRLSVLAGPRLSSLTSSGSIYVVAGVEADRAAMRWSPLEPLIGPDTVRRRFVGGALGIVRRAARYDTLGWVLRHDGIVDVPTVTEGELVAAFGRDGVDGRTKTHIDGWTARTWTLADRSLIAGGLWSSGYVADKLVEAATLRGSLATLTPTANGAWQFRLTAERLYDPDPTVRVLRSVDPVGALLPSTARLAKVSASISAERDFRVLDISRASSELDAAVFGAFAGRWQTASVPDVNVGASLVGLGLRLAPSRTPGGIVRLDVGYPVGYRFGMRARPVVAVELVPWLTAGHQRDGTQPQ